MQVRSMQSRQSARAPVARRAGVSRTRVVRVSAKVNKDQLKAAYDELKGYIQSRFCNPIIVRLAWHDSGTYNKEVKDWPARGGATGSIRFQPEIGHDANKGLNIALNLLKPIAKKYPDVSYADLFQMASAAAVEAAGGPKLNLRYGRRDATGPQDCAPDGNLPAAAHPFPDGSLKPADHLRKVFYRMGLDDRDIVALSGAHTLGRARPERSGQGVDKTKYTEKGPGTPGGQSWTVDWLVFNNGYFKEIKEKRDKDLLVLETDACIFEDEGFRPYAEKYAADEAAFFKDYAEAHKKLSELGVEWVEGAPVTI